jgi:hypothetical protein
MFSTAVYTRKGALFSQVVAKMSEHTDRELVVQYIVAVAIPVHKMHIGVFFIGNGMFTVTSRCTLITARTELQCC